MRARTWLLVCLAGAVAICLCLFVCRTSNSKIDNKKWDAIEASHPVIVLADVKTADHAYTHHFVRFIKNNDNLTRESVQKLLARFDSSLKTHESIGKQAIFLIDDATTSGVAGPAVAGSYYVYDGCITLHNANNVRVELDYITGVK